MGSAETNAWIRGYARFAQLCGQRNGKLLAHVSTKETAKDLDLLRRAVGAPELNYLGVSYGTFLGATYANLFPDKVRAMVLDGNVDPVAWTNGGRNDARLGTSLRIGSDLGSSKTLKAFLALCGQTATDHCDFSAGSAEATQAKFAILLQRLRKQPVTLEGKTLTYAVLVTAISDDLFVTQEFAEFSGWRKAGELLQKAWNAPPASSTDPSTVPLILPDDAGLAVQCAESPNPRNPNIYGQLAVFSFARARDVGPNVSWGDEPCAAWPATAVERYSGPWNRRTAHTILVIGNTYDPATPYENSVAMVRALSRARLLTVDGYGHTALLNPSKCANDYETAYFINGKLPPDGTVCQQNQRPFTPNSSS